MIRIGLGQISGDLGSRVNSGETAPPTLEPGRYLGTAGVFRDQYGFARALFGADTVDRYWFHSWAILCTAIHYCSGYEIVEKKCCNYGNYLLTLSV